LDSVSVEHKASLWLREAGPGGEHIVGLSTGAGEGDKAEMLALWVNEAEGAVLVDCVEGSGDIFY
jgi:hypothetical protein